MLSSLMIEFLPGLTPEGLAGASLLLPCILLLAAGWVAKWLRDA
jgi:hypothetical protein